MKILYEQFRTAFPTASITAAAALFARDTKLVTVIERILTDHGITEPPAVAHFLTACGLASKDFTNFNTPVYGLGAPDWLATRARAWQELGLSSEAADWNTDYIVQRLPEELFPLPGNWPAVWHALDAVCAALGVEVPSDGADEGASGNS